MHLGSDAGHEQASKKKLKLYEHVSQFPKIAPKQEQYQRSSTQPYSIFRGLEMRYSYSKQGIIFIALSMVAPSVRRFSCAPDSGITGRTDGRTAKEGATFARMEWNGQNIEE